MSQNASVLDGNLFATRQMKTSRVTLRPFEDVKKSQFVQLMEVTRKLAEEHTTHLMKARDAMKRLPNTAKPILATNGAPTDR